MVSNRSRVAVTSIGIAWCSAARLLAVVSMPLTIISLAIIFFTVAIAPGMALPFNNDMGNMQSKRDGEIARNKVAGTVPMGSSEYMLQSKEAAWELENPVARDVFSVRSGQRLWNINCGPCHGLYSESGEHSLGAVSQYLPAVDVTSDYYKEKSDGYIYGVIHFGGLAVMPAYGWKLSPTEHWHIVNYVRHIQNLEK